ncbi:hypothetical protein [Pseudomonas phage COT4]|uniref:Uncharacterized protein n=1 Tax=Pseudomonas phage M5.1 TaxID=2873460 RepID=A0AAE8XDX7_9CAUD|nr:hypothetical protein QGX13_gp011 [Pseudomonas phage M5.1]UAV89612.1 hypothetical protein M51_11 [Pseudomonas phage M5.1]UGL61211.1 hypothetical protein [Pseudomonas phage COT4]
MTLPALDEKHLAALKKLLAETYDLIESTVHVRFDAEGRMHVTARKNGVVRHVQINVEVVNED